MRRIAVIVTLLAALLHARAADAKQVRFVGVHPIVAELGGGFCYIEVPHVHVYEPARAEVLYRVHDGAYFFVGDPVAHGYDGPKHAYYGHHPIAADVILEEDELDGDEIEYCYIDGPHYHYYLPPTNAKFSVRGGIYWYLGDLPAEYERGRPRFAKINVVYKPMKYTRPVVVVAPPPEYRGVVVELEAPRAEVVVEAPAPPPPAHVRAGVGVGVGVRAGVEVHVPAPTVEVRVGGGVIVEDDHHHHHHHDHGKKKGKKKVKVKWR